MEEYKNKMSNEDFTFSVHDAAFYIGRTEARVRQLVKEGVFKYIKVENRILIDKHDLTKYYNEHKVINSKKQKLEHKWCDCVRCQKLNKCVYCKYTSTWFNPVEELFICNNCIEKFKDDVQTSILATPLVNSSDLLIIYKKCNHRDIRNKNTEITEDCQICKVVGKES
jgi:hypothetical protein